MSNTVEVADGSTVFIDLEEPDDVAGLDLDLEGPVLVLENGASHTYVITNPGEFLDRLSGLVELYDL